MKKTILLAAAAALLFMFSSCGLIIINNPTGSEETTSASSSDNGQNTTGAETDENNASVKESAKKTAEKYLGNLPAADTKGMSFIIAGPAVKTFFPEETATTVDTARYESLKMVKNKYNAKIIAVESADETVYADLSSSVASGLYYADLMVLPEEKVGSYYAAGLLLNMRSLPFVSFSSAYYDEKSVLSSTIGSGIYSVSGEACENIDSYFAVYFNTALALRLQLPDLYNLAGEGKWTWDEMLSISKTAASALNSGAEYGTYGEEELWSTIVSSSAGLSFVVNETGKLPLLAAADETKDKALSAVKSLFSSELLFKPGSGYDRYTVMQEFYNGKLLFYIDTLKETESIADSTDSWGLLPVPKLTEQQDYSAPANNAAVFAVPKNNATLTETGLLLEAFNAASCEWVAEEYVNFQMNYRVRDERTLDMIDIIRKNVYRDFSVLYGGAYPAIESACGGTFLEAVKAGSTDFAKIQTKYKKAASASLSSLPTKP